VATALSIVRTLSGGRRQTARTGVEAEAEIGDHCLIRQGEIKGREEGDQLAEIVVDAPE
jgi:hypothetical protein